MTELTFFNKNSIEASNLGTIPNVNNKPPILKASSTRPIVNNMLSIPPRVNSSSISSIPVFETNPPNNVSNNSLIGVKPLINETSIALTEPAASANNAGAFIIEKTSKKTSGITPLYQCTSPVSNSPHSILLKSVVVISGDMIPNSTSVITNAGIVVQPMFRICVNKSTFNMEEAIFVVSDNGDILSPKNAPDTIAPAVIARETSIAPDIPINATPTVPTVVSELPTQIPTIEVTMKTTVK